MSRSEERRSRSPGGDRKRRHRSRSRSAGRRRSRSPMRSRSPEHRRHRSRSNPRKSRRRERSRSPTRNSDPIDIKAKLEAKAAEIAKSIGSKSGFTSISSETEKAQQTANSLTSQVTSQLSTVASILQTVKREKKVVARALRLDDQGREIDEHGNVIQQTTVVKTLAANLMAQREKKKKENPYLSHRSTAGSPETITEELGVDPRLVVRGKHRESHLKKALNFVEAGTYALAEEKMKQKEERKVIAGYASGRKAPEVLGAVTGDVALTASEDALPDSVVPDALNVPPPIDEGLVVPIVEWWDEAFLPKDPNVKKQMQLLALEGGPSIAKPLSKQEPTLQPTKLASTQNAETEQQTQEHSVVSLHDFLRLLSIFNCKTHKYIQHPVPPKPLGGERAEEPLKAYLTKKERKRLRKQVREEREREKRDKMMMGLIAPPEPKFKLSNFMKILGDQAVADPSKIEQKVIQQMRKRQLNHEMRNQARKLTPQERKEKKRKKCQEDTSRQVHVAVFKVFDLSDRKKQFKVDVTAQQHNLTGIVLLSSNPSVLNNLVVVEGGPNGIKNFIKLMTRRIPWKVPSDAYENPANHEAYPDIQAEDEGGVPVPGVNKPMMDPLLNECILMWQGIVPKRIFHTFKFQEFKSASAARKSMEQKNVEHYWDMSLQYKISN